MNDVEKALSALGIDVISHRGSELLCLCPMHEERTGKVDRNPSWQINGDTGAHICFSCGYKGNLISLVCDIKQFQIKWGAADTLDVDAAKKWLESSASMSYEDLAKNLNKVVQKTPAEAIPMSEARLAVYGEVPKWALDRRNLTALSAAEYGVRWDDKTSSWITPIRDPDTGTLWGWQEKGEKERRFKNQPAGVKKSHTLFGINNYRNGPMILVESPLDAVRIHSAGIEHAVSSFGAQVSAEQVRLLRRSDHLIIAMDNPSVDPAGLKASEFLLDMCRKYAIEASFFNYGDLTDKDVGTMTDEQIHEGIYSAKHMVYGRKAIGV
jgi:hypothetical protein